MSIQTISTRYGPVEVRITGNGTPVLLLHGAHSTCRDELVTAGLDTVKLQIIQPSRPGYGKTHPGRELSLEETAGMFAEVMKQLDINHYTVYGISAGGGTAIAIAARFPEQVKSLALVSAVTKTWPEQGRGMASTLFHPYLSGITWGIIRMCSYLLPIPLAKIFRKHLSSAPSGSKPSLREIIRLNQALRTYNSGYGFIRDIKQSATIPAGIHIKCPVLIVHSAYDKAVPLSHALKLKEETAQCELRILKNYWGHMVWIGAHAERVSEILNKFFDR